MGRNSAAEAANTRARIVDAAVARASMNGLEQVTVRDLAADLELSKSGVAGPFASREELLALAFDRAMDTFRETVIDPTLAQPVGPKRIDRLVERWCAYLVDCPFPGGCFITTASVEFDNRPGELRDRVVAAVQSWRSFLHEQLRGCYPGTTTTQAHLAVTILTGISMATNQEIQLLGDPKAANRGRRAMRSVIEDMRPLT